MAEDYLKILWKAEERGTGPVTTRDIASILGVAASSVSGNLRKLDRDELIVHEPYYRIALTDRGRRVAVGMVRRHRLIETFLVDQLGYGWHEVHDEAEVLEHAVSDTFLERIDALLGHPSVDPHGDPIPSADGVVPTTPGALIAALPEGSCGTVARVYDDRPELLQYLAERGIALGGHVRVLQRMHGAGILRVERAETAGSHEQPVDLPDAAADAIWLAPDEHAAQLPA
ncbi:DtxR family transcriptional regulator [Arenivirga flava]|uniref:Manganese transport regulator n=2 Tax=Arenivirga flava TaxID=1930060 RepID=A0AA37UH83_9MICO|nr:DtxR family transcriptional regulator [Arenivirga flava]